MTTDKEGNPLLHYPGDYNVARARAPRHRLSAGGARREGVSTQVITLTTPGHARRIPVRAAESARLVTTHSPESSSIAHHGFARWRRCPHDPRLRSSSCGVRSKGSATRCDAVQHVNGVALSDERFWPLYEAADGLGAVLHIHPTVPSVSRR